MKFLIVLSIAVLAGLLIINYRGDNAKVQTTQQMDLAIANPTEKPEIIIENLNTPWELVFLPDGETLITERPGTLVSVKPDGTVTRIEVPDITQVGEGGLMGLALDPDFNSNRYIYLYYTTGSTTNLSNRVDRFTYNDGTLSERFNVISGIPGGSNHDGGRITFGPDGFLYIGTGDSGNNSLSQDTNSSAGKILRISKDGSIPTDNPFGNAVYSYGHRNVQGLTWDDRGRLWATEHGPSGIQTGNDELNRIDKGNNYGWPLITGTETRTGMVPPVITSGSTETWAPAGAVYKDGSIYFGGLRGQALYEAKIDGNSVTLVKHYEDVYGRIRIVTKDNQGNLYFGSSNTDGRGTVKSNDDKIFKISTP